MREQIEIRLRELARRAGLAGVPTPALVAAFAVCVAVVCFAAWRWWPRDAALTALDSAQAAQGGALGASGAETGSGDAGGGSASGVEGGATAESTASMAAYVHVVGAVRRPGMYQLADGARVADAIDAAGGMLANAAQAGVNLARLVADGEQIVVPTADELAHGGPAPASAGAVQVPSGPAGGAAAGGAQVNINTADAAALDTLPGVGPSTAAKIVADREANGPFSSADDLGRVAGIGPKKLEELKPRVCVR